MCTFFVGDNMYNEKYMIMALNEAAKAYKLNEVPVGAVIVKNDTVVCRSHNKNKKNNCIINHAEIDAIELACKKLGDWRLNECEMYVTLEPCPMCAGAILNSRIKKIYIGTESNIKSNRSIVLSILQNQDYYHFTEVEYVNNVTASKFLTDFFENKR